MREITSELKLAILLARYHCSRPVSPHPTYMSLQRLANVLGITRNQATHVCRQHFCKLGPKKPKVKGTYNAVRPGRPRQLMRKGKPFKPEHIQWLTSDSTLREQAGVTIATRCKLLHRRFPDMRISTTRLLQVYRQHSIRRKRVRQAKLPPRLSLGSYVSKTDICR